MLAGAARRGAASVGSLLIAAVPSSPIESDGFPTSSFCGARRGRRRAGGVLRVGIFAVLFAFGAVFLGGQPRMGVFAEATRTDGGLSCLWVGNDLLAFGIFTQQRWTVISLVLRAAVLKLGAQRASDRTNARRGSAL